MTRSRVCCIAPLLNQTIRYLLKKQFFTLLPMTLRVELIGLHLESVFTQEYMAWQRHSLNHFNFLFSPIFLFCYAWIPQKDVMQNTKHQFVTTSHPVLLEMVGPAGYVLMIRSLVLPKQLGVLAAGPGGGLGLAVPGIQVGQRSKGSLELCQAATPHVD